ncbi:MAG: 3-deoxy-8-phosphooctulonate synthase [Planctomycetota bacterium]|nr:MAG: 3-deoxy-8-phosphooctulonate synthase [Planctomycetota bacterium]
MQAPKPVTIGDFQVGADAPLFAIAGPCVLESREHTLRHAEAVADCCRALNLPFVFKSSFDKANRTSLQSYRGPGLETGLEWLAAARDAIGAPVLTDIHEKHQAAPVAEVCEILQIPAFLCRQTDLLVAAAETGRCVNIKKGQFLAAEDMQHPLHKVQESGNSQVLLTERGTSFGYHRLVVDFGGLVTLRSLGAPVVFDATHSVQRPSAGQGKSSGDRSLVAPLARAAAAVGIDGLFLEVHQDPERAPSDGPNMVPLSQLPKLLEEVLRLDAARRCT